MDGLLRSLAAVVHCFRVPGVLLRFEHGESTDRNRGDNILGVDRLADVGSVNSLADLAFTTIPPAPEAPLEKRCTACTKQSHVLRPPSIALRRPCMVLVAHEHRSGKAVLVYSREVSVFFFNLDSMGDRHLLVGSFPEFIV